MAASTARRQGSKQLEKLSNPRGASRAVRSGARRTGL